MVKEKNENAQNMNLIPIKSPMDLGKKSIEDLINENKELLDKVNFINRISISYTDDYKLPIEDKFLYQRRIRSYGVGLRHISNNISDVKDYMLSCKLAYTNRVCISPDKNGVNMNILEYIEVDE